MPSLSIGPHTASVPIIQGGMGVRISLSKLAAAVANEGGIGVISATGLGFADQGGTDVASANQRFLIHEIREARRLSKGIIGLNLLAALSDYDKLLEIAFTEKIDIVFAGAGLPLKFPQSVTPEILKNGHTRFVPIVSSAKAAQVIFKYWSSHYNQIPDALVVEGPMAGGHLGFSREQLNDPAYALDKLVPEVLEVAHIFGKRFGKVVSVIAAGGVYTGADIRRYIAMGASGVQMGTRFVATNECDASDSFKRAYIQCSKDDIDIINSPVGMPGRAIKNNFLRRIDAGQKQQFQCQFQCLRTCHFDKASYCIASALNNAQQGHMDEGFAFAGANAWRVDSIMSVHELIATLKAEYCQALCG